MLDKPVVNSLVQLIDLCSSRGAFRGEELSTVGSLRELLVNESKRLEAEEKETKETKETVEEQ